MSMIKNHPRAQKLPYVNTAQLRVDHLWNDTKRSSGMVKNSDKCTSTNIELSCIKWWKWITCPQIEINEILLKLRI